MCEQCRPPGPFVLGQYTEEELEALTSEQINELIKESKKRPTVYEHWRERGAYYGYPSCCVNSFVRRPLETDFTKYELAYSKAGFLPCRKHLKMIKQGKIKIEDLIQNRKCITPFPIDDLDAKLLKELLDNDPELH